MGGMGGDGTRAGGRAPSWGGEGQAGEGHRPREGVRQPQEPSEKEALT